MNRQKSCAGTQGSGYSTDSDLKADEHSGLVVVASKGCYSNRLFARALRKGVTQGDGVRAG